MNRYRLRLCAVRCVVRCGPSFPKARFVTNDHRPGLDIVYCRLLKPRAIMSSIQETGWASGGRQVGRVSNGGGAGETSTVPLHQCVPQQLPTGRTGRRNSFIIPGSIGARVLNNASRGSDASHSAWNVCDFCGDDQGRRDRYFVPTCESSSSSRASSFL